MKKRLFVLGVFFFLVLSVSVAASNGFSFWQMLIDFFSGSPTGASTFSTAAVITTGACFMASGLGAVAGDEIQLTGNIATGSGNCAVMDVFNTTLNCSGFTISNTGAAADGLRITAANVTVFNCIVANFTNDNVEITSAGDNFTLRSLTVVNGSGASTDGIALSGADGGVIENSFINNNSGQIIAWSSSNNGLVRNNTFNGTGTFTVSLQSSANLTVRNNTWTTDRDNSTTSIDALSGFNNNNLTVRDHVNVTMSFDIGLCNNCTVDNNTFSGNGLISIFGGNNTVSNNSWASVTIEGQTSGGIEISQNLIGASSALVANNFIANGQMMSIMVSSNMNVTNNTIANVSGTAFEVVGQNSSLSNNTITNFTGTVFKVFNDSSLFVTNNSILFNNLTFVVQTVNTTFNLANLTTPPIPDGTIGVFLGNNVNNTIIDRNNFSVQNPSGLSVGVIGVRSTNGSSFTQVLNNYFEGLQTAVILTNSNNSVVGNNTIFESTYKGVIISSGMNISVRQNNVADSTPVLSPSVNEAGIEVLRYSSNNLLVSDNNISGYHSGIYLLNVSGGNFTNNSVISANGYGLFANSCFNINVSNLTTSSTVTTGLKFLFTNSSLVLNITASGGQSGIEFYRSNSNTINGSSLSSMTTVGLLFDLFSSTNSVNNNAFALNPTDIICDMFSSSNTGSGNGGPLVTQENGASGCTIT